MTSPNEAYSEAVAFLDELAQHPDQKGRVQAVVRKLALLRSARAPQSETAPSGTAKVPEGWRGVLAKARNSLGAAGGTGVAGAHYSELELKIGIPLLDWIEDQLEQLATTPSPTGNEEPR